MAMGQPKLRPLTERHNENSFAIFFCQSNANTVGRLTPFISEVIAGDDPSFGVHLRYLRDDPSARVPRLTLDDRDSYRVFAMEPSCNEALWSHVTQRSWVIHHVSPEQIQCMWKVDLEAGIYEDDGESGFMFGSSAALRHAEVDAQFATNPEMQEPFWAQFQGVETMPEATCTLFRNQLIHCCSSIR